MFADLADNPTGASLPVGSAVLGPAAAAAVLNLVLVWGIGAAMHVAALVMMYAALVGGGAVGRGAVPGLQRATASLRLAALCANSVVDDEASGDAGGSGSAMYADLADNPTDASLPVGSAVLGPAAAAAVLNLVLVWGI
ncbi:GPI-anchored surface protein, putative, partial [Bodo saltans]